MATQLDGIFSAGQIHLSSVWSAPAPGTMYVSKLHAVVLDATADEPALKTQEDRDLASMVASVCVFYLVVFYIIWRRLPLRELMRWVLASLCLSPQGHLSQYMTEDHRADQHLALVAVQQMAVVRVTQFHNNLRSPGGGRQNIFQLEIAHHGTGISFLAGTDSVTAE